MGKEDSGQAIRQFKRHQHLAREGARPDVIFQLEEGWACRYRILSGGRRQITALFLPGEFCEPQWLLGEARCAAIVALTAVRVRSISLVEMPKLILSGTDGLTTMLSATLSALNRQSDWIVSLGRKSAVERLCAFFAEIFERSQTNSRSVEDQCPMPLTQADIADAVGLTPVHVNRIIKQLKTDRVLELAARTLRIRDPEALRRLGCMRPTGGPGGADPAPVGSHLKALSFAN
jgi:CRP-like cAMP-binding protein